MAEVICDPVDSSLLPAMVIGSQMTWPEGIKVL